MWTSLNVICLIFMISQCLQHKRKTSINESPFISAFDLDLLFICKFRGFFYALIRGFGLGVHVFSNSQIMFIVKVQLTSNTCSDSTNAKLEYLLKLDFILTVIIKFQLFFKAVCLLYITPPPQKKRFKEAGCSTNYL